MLFLKPTRKNPISFRSFDLSKDLTTIHDWVNRPYSREFWQLSGPVELLRDTYTALYKIRTPILSSAAKGNNWSAR